MAAVGQCVVRLAGRSCNSSGTAAHICASVPDVREIEEPNEFTAVNFRNSNNFWIQYNWTASKIVELFNFSTNVWDRRTITVPPEAVAREFRGGKAGQRGSRVEKKREIRGKINGMLTVTRRPRKQARDHLEDQRRDGQGMSYHPVNLIIRVRVFQDAQDFHAPRPIMPRVLSTIPV